MMSSNFKVAVLSCLFLSVQAKTKAVYSFAEGRSHPEGLVHGARGHDCLKEFHASIHGGDMEFVKQVESNVNGEEVTDEHVAAAIFMAFGEEGINKICAMNDRWKEAHQTRRLNLVPTDHQKDPERNTQSTRACSGGADVGYPSASKADPQGIYKAYVEQRLASVLPDGAGAKSRTSPEKMVQEGQTALDSALEAGYGGKICGTFFSAFSALGSIPDLVVVKQEPIFEGINSLTCGVAENVALSLQGSLRGLLSDGMKHDALINDAETAATYQNTVVIAEEMCGMASNMARMNGEVETIKEKINSR